MLYQYKESGLDNIYLENGYRKHKTPYGEGIAIHNAEGLHKAIGKWLIALPKPLNGAELRFLRLEMEQTQNALASIIGTTEQTLRLWEKHRSKSVPGPADRILRTVYSEYIGGDGNVRRMLERLAQLDQLEKVEAHFHVHKINKHWKPRNAPQFAERGS